jgi:hypothetical protein
MPSLHSSTSLDSSLYRHLRTLLFAIMLKLTFLSIMPGLHCAGILLPRTAGKRRESVVFLDQVAVLNVLVRVQVNHLSAVMLTILLLPCLFQAASSGTSPNPRVVIVASDVHYWTKFSKTEVESEKILRKLSDKDHCTSRWGILFYIGRW